MTMQEQEQDQEQSNKFLFRPRTVVFLVVLAFLIGSNMEGFHILWNNKDNARNWVLLQKEIPCTAILDSITKTLSTTTTTTATTALDFHFCRVPQIPSLSTPYQNFTLQYQCHGTAYQKFSQELYNTILQQQQQEQNEYRGKRMYPIPSNKKILVLGNSHLRQVSKTLICQYKSVITNFTILDGDTFAIQFANNATWISITNSPFVYSHEWVSLLEQHVISPMIQSLLLNDDPVPISTTTTTISDMDVIIFGKFTTFQEAKNTNFETLMQQQTQQYHPLVQFDTIPPPDLENVANEFTKKHHGGSILAMNMFAQHDMQRFLNLMKHQEEFSTMISLENNDNNNHNNIHFINSRQYIPILGECGTDDKLTIGTCHDAGHVVPNSTRDPSNMHRCAGSNGGHADLIAWDIIESLYII